MVAASCVIVYFTDVFFSGIFNIEIILVILTELKGKMVRLIQFQMLRGSKLLGFLYNAYI